MEHKAGKKGMMYSYAESKEQGNECPVIATYQSVYHCVNNEEAAANLERMKERKEEFRRQQSQEFPDTPADELPPLEWSSNLEVLEAGVGKRRGKEVRGLGKMVVRELNSSSRERMSSAELKALKEENAMMKAKMSEMEQRFSMFESFMQQYGNQQGGAHMDNPGGSSQSFGQQ